MKVVTRQQRANRAAHQWYKAHTYHDGREHDGEWKSVPHAYTRYKALVALGEHPDPDAVDEAAGHPLTGLSCEECGQAAEAVVLLGGCRDEEEPCLQICCGCAWKAIGEFAEVLMNEGS